MLRTKPEAAKPHIPPSPDHLLKSIVQESLIISDHHHGLNLLDRLEHNADHDDQARSSERYGSVEHASEEKRKNTDDRKADRADEDDVVEDPAQIIARRLAGTDTRDEAAALFQVICNLQRIECDRCIEVCEEFSDYQQSPAD